MEVRTCHRCTPSSSRPGIHDARLALASMEVRTCRRCTPSSHHRDRHVKRARKLVQSHHCNCCCWICFLFFFVFFCFFFLDVVIVRGKRRKEESREEARRNKEKYRGTNDRTSVQEGTKKKRKQKQFAPHVDDDKLTPRHPRRNVYVCTQTILLLLPSRWHYCAAPTSCLVNWTLLS